MSLVHQRGGLKWYTKRIFRGSEMDYYHISSRTHMNQNFKVRLPFLTLYLKKFVYDQTFFFCSFFSFQSKLYEAIRVHKVAVTYKNKKIFLQDGYISAYKQLKKILITPLHKSYCRNNHIYCNMRKHL